ncbi:MAG: hypothetical protein ABIS44_07250 [Mycobacteriales bacterium]
MYTSISAWLSGLVRQRRATDFPGSDGADSVAAGSELAAEADVAAEVADGTVDEAAGVPALVAVGAALSSFLVLEQALTANSAPTNSAVVFLSVIG